MQSQIPMDLELDRDPQGVMVEHEICYADNSDDERYEGGSQESDPESADDDSWDSAASSSSVLDDADLGICAEDGSLCMDYTAGKVSELEYRAADFILNCGPSKQGLSQKITSAYLNSLATDSIVLRKWRTAKSFWEDHEQRLQFALRRTGRWKKVAVTSVRDDIPIYYSYIRNLPDTIVHIIETAELTYDGPISYWSRNQKITPTFVYDVDGRRRIDDFYSADDLMYVQRALCLRAGKSSHMFMPVQFFIDKANVTRLNKRSMYPIVMYLLCFSRSVRRQLAVNVGFLPVVRNVSITGRRKSDEITKFARASALQETLGLLLELLKESLCLRARFPDGVTREFTPFIFSVTTDLPEMAMVSSVKYGLNTAFPCPRCFVSLANVDERYPPDAVPRSASRILSWYNQIERKPLKRDRDAFLVKFSLRLPPSIFLTRFEMNLDSYEIENVLNAAEQLVGVSKPFGLSCLQRFEQMHNCDQGFTQTLLQSIEHYFAVLRGQSLATSIIDTANGWQSGLPRRSVSDGLFRLPAMGLMISKTHANVNATQFKSSLCVLPFLLHGTVRNRDEETADAMVALLEYILSYLQLHHYVRRINTVPWFMYDDLEAEVDSRIDLMVAKYEASIGRTRNQTVGQFQAGEG